MSVDEQADLLVLVEIDSARGLEVALEHVDRAVAVADREREVLARRAVGVALRLLDRPDDGLQQLDTAVGRAEGDDRLMGLTRSSRAACRMAVGDTSGARVDAQQAVSILKGVDRAIAMSQRAAIVARLGREAEALSDLDEAIAPIFHLPPLIKYEYTSEVIAIYYHVDLNGLFNPSSNCQPIHSPTEASQWTIQIQPTGGWVIDTAQGDPGHPGITDADTGSNGQARGTLSAYHYAAASTTAVAVTGNVCGSSNAGPGAIFQHTYRVYEVRTV